MIYEILLSSERREFLPSNLHSKSLLNDEEMMSKFSEGMKMCLNFIIRTCRSCKRKYEKSENWLRFFIFSCNLIGNMYSRVPSKNSFYMATIIASRLKSVFQLFGKKRNQKMEESKQVLSKVDMEDQVFLLDLLYPLGDELGLLHGLEELCLFVQKSCKVNIAAIRQSKVPLIFEGPWKLTDDHGGRLTVHEIKVQKDQVLSSNTAEVYALEYALEAKSNSSTGPRILHSFVPIRG